MLSPHLSATWTAVPVALVILALLAGCIGPDNAAVDLGAASDFAVLAGSGITNTGTTIVNGDVGSFPTTSQTGFGPGADSVIITGTNHGGDAATQDAKIALQDAYDDAAGRTWGIPIAGGELGGLILIPGVYRDDDAPDSLGLTGTVTLDGLGDPDSVFIFQSGSTLTTASGSTVLLTNGTRPCNVHWQITSSATLGTGSNFTGNLMALTSITLATDAGVVGRVLARNGAVTMDNNTVSLLMCEPLAPTPTATTPIPVFPTRPAVIVALMGALIGAGMIFLRKRR